MRSSGGSARVLPAMVWADLFNLRAGSPFWRDIEQTIRQEAYTVIVVASHASVDPSRSGVHNEIALADTIKMQLGRDDFLVPLRIDDVPFADFPIQIHRLNAVDFRPGWGAGLELLLQELEKASVPRSTTQSTHDFDRWRQAMNATAVIVEDGKESYLSNILPIQGLPSRVKFYQPSGDASAVSDSLRLAAIPHALHLDRVVTFADLEELEEHLPGGATLRIIARPFVGELLAGNAQGPVMPRPRDARNMLTGILTQEVERLLAGRGLKTFETSSGPVYYFPAGLLQKDRVTYINAASAKIWKAVVGRSEKFAVNWHLGMKLAVRLGDDNAIRLRPYVVFSTDGTAITDPDRMARIRRRFCKSWWN
jgi:hypothetical protein